MTVPLACQRAGAGRPLVPVHGYLGGSAQWRDQIAAFAPTHDVTAPDLPGFGAAAPLPGPDSIAGFAQAVLDCLDRLGVGRVTLPGHSVGGMIVQDIAARHPDRVERLILCGTGPLGRVPDRFGPQEVSMDRLAADGVVPTADRICATWFRDGDRAPGYPFVRDLGGVLRPRPPGRRLGPCATGPAAPSCPAFGCPAASIGATGTGPASGHRWTSCGRA